MKILHVSNKPVYPLVDGGCIAMSKILQSLIVIADTVEHAFIHTHKHPLLPEAYPPEFRIVLNDKSAFVNTEVNPLGAFSALISGKNYNLKRFRSKGFEKALTEHVRDGSFDAIVLESLFLSGYIPALRKVTQAKIVLRAHNVEHELWEQQALMETSPLRRRYLHSLAKSLKREEIAALNSADVIWAITGEDALRFEHLGIKTQVVTIPVAMEIRADEPDYYCADFFHLGSLNWAPNQLAVKELVSNIWPRLHVKGKLHIAGSFPETAKEMTGEQVIFHGFVENAADFMQSNGTLVTPVRTGSGVRIKLLEALSLGVPCITTRLGAIGIRDPQQVMLIADTEREWLETMERIAGSAELRRELGEAAKHYMEKYHSFAAINAQLSASLER